MLVTNAWYVAAWADEISAKPTARRRFGTRLALTATEADSD